MRKTAGRSKMSGLEAQQAGARPRSMMPDPRRLSFAHVDSCRGGRGEKDRAKVYGFESLEGAGLVCLAATGLSWLA